MVRCCGFIILLMQIQGEASLEQCPFEIIHNARSSRATRSRKSSIHIIQKEKVRHKFKKDRKMTLNPQSLRQQDIAEIDQRHKEQKGPASLKGSIKEEEFNIDDFLELGAPRRIQSQKEQMLQNGIFFGIGSERDLDSDFDLSYTQQQKLEMEVEGQ